MGLGNAVELVPLGHADVVAEILWVVWGAFNFDPMHTSSPREHKPPDGLLRLDGKGVELAHAVIGWRHVVWLVLSHVWIK